MKYHLVPAPKQIPNDIDVESRIETIALNREVLGFLKKLTKRDASNYNKLFYLYDENSMRLLNTLLANPIAPFDDDEIIIHAEGYPFMIASSISGAAYSFTAFELAKFLKTHVLSEHPITINLLACNSATDFCGSNFSRDLSRALTYYLDHPKNKVTGYTGFVTVKNNAKFAVSSVLGQSVKGSHASIDDAKMIYQSGEELYRGKELIPSLTHFSFQWAQKYVNKMLAERRFISASIEQKKILSFFPSPSLSEIDVLVSPRPE